MEISTPQTIFTQKNIKGYMVQQYPYSTRWEKIVVVILHVYELQPSFYYFVFTKPLNLSNVQYLLAYISQYSSIKIC